MQNVFFHFLLVNQVEQLQHGTKHMSKCGKSTVTPYYLEILKQKFQILTEYELFPLSNLMNTSNESNTQTE